VSNRSQRQVEPRGPAANRPLLLDARDLGHVIVLDPGEVPDQPGDRVGLGVEPGGEGLLVKALDRLVHHAVHPLEPVDEQVADARH
jgi:hypothetical protein